VTVAMVVLMWGLASTALWTSEINWSRGLHIVLHRYVLEVVLWLWIYWCRTFWLVTQSHSPIYINPSTYPSLTSMFQSAWNITFISQVIWSASTICLDLLLSKLCSIEKYLLRGHCMVAREIRVLITPLPPVCREPVVRGLDFHQTVPG